MKKVLPWTAQSTAQDFFEACEAGKGWEACQPFCTPEATFSAQAEPLAEVKTLQAYADWMKSIMQMMPDGKPGDVPDAGRVR